MKLFFVAAINTPVPMDGSEDLERTSAGQSKWRERNQNSYTQRPARSKRTGQPSKRVFMVTSQCRMVVEHSVAGSHRSISSRDDAKTTCRPVGKTGYQCMNSTVVT